MTFHHQITVNTIAISHKTVLLSQGLKKDNKTCLVPNIALFITLEKKRGLPARHGGLEKHAIVSDHP